MSYVARHSSKPTKVNWRQVKRIFRYLIGTINYGIFYSKNCNAKCIGYPDSDWAGDTKDRKSTSGYRFTMNGALISWKTSKQTCVALSTAEAEYVALASAAQEAVWLNKFLADIHSSHKLPIVINEYNQAAISIAKNPKEHSKTKHIAIKYHLVRDKIANNEIAFNIVLLSLC